MLTATLKLPDIKGESRRDGHEEEIDILSIQWSMAQSAHMQIGSGRTKSRATVDPIVLSKEADAATPYLAQATLMGKAFDEAVISFRKDSGEEHLDYLVITLTNVVISSYSMSGSAGSDSIVESLGLSFEEIEEVYTVQADDHSSGAEHTFAYNLALGK